MLYRGKIEMTTAQRELRNKAINAAVAEVLHILDHGPGAKDHLINGLGQLFDAAVKIGCEQALEYAVQKQLRF